jgi:hypothetical protein
MRLRLSSAVSDFGVCPATYSRSSNTCLALDRLRGVFFCFTRILLPAFRWECLHFGFVPSWSGLRKCAVRAAHGPRPTVQFVLFRIEIPPKSMRKRSTASEIILLLLLLSRYTHPGPF